MKYSRKEFLKVGLAAGVGLSLPLGAPACSLLGSGSKGPLLASKAKLPEPFRVPLPVPPVLEPERSDAKAHYYTVTQKAGKAQILPGPKTKV